MCVPEYTIINDFDIRGKYLIKVTVIKQLTEKQPIIMLQNRKVKKERVPMKEHFCERAGHYNIIVLDSCLIIHDYRIVTVVLARLVSH